MPTTNQVSNGSMIRPFLRLMEANIQIDLMSCLAEVDEYLEALDNDGTEVSFSDGTYDSEDDWEAEEDAFISKLEATDSASPNHVESTQSIDSPAELSLQENPAAKRIYRRLLLQLLWPLSDPDVNLLQVYENTKVIDPKYHQTEFHRKVELWKTLSVIRQQLDAAKEDNYRLQSMRLNIEFYMYKSFEEEFEGYSMARNPFMVHWLEFIDGETTNPEDRILVYFIRGLLKGHSQKFERATPREIITNTDWKYDLDTKSLRKKLSSYDLDPPRIPAHRVKEADIPFDREAAAEKTAELKKLEEAFMSELQMYGDGETDEGPTSASRTIKTARTRKPTVITAAKQDVAYGSDYSQEGGANNFSPASRSPTSSSTSVDGLDCANSPIQNLIYQINLAVDAPCAEKEKETIYDHLRQRPEDLYEADYFFFNTCFPSMLESNKDLAAFLVRSYLFAIPTDKLDGEKRQSCLVNLSCLPITLNCLDLITGLLVPAPRQPGRKIDPLNQHILEPQDAHLLLHRFLATSLRTLDVESSYTNSLATRKRIANDKIKYLCVFIRNLIAKNFIVNRSIISPDDFTIVSNVESAEDEADDDDHSGVDWGIENYFYEMQDLNVRFMWSPDVRSVWDQYKRSGIGGTAAAAATPAATPAAKSKGKEKAGTPVASVGGGKGRNGVLSDID